MRFSWGLRWLVLLTVLAVIGGAATLGIGHFRHATDRARKSEFRLTDVQSAAYAANAAEWRMIARRRTDPVDSGTFAHSVAAIRNTVQQSARLVNQLGPFGVEARIRQVNGYFRVYVGPYGARDDARRMADRLRAELALPSTIAAH